MYLPAVMCPFLMHIWELKKQFSEDEKLEQFLFGWYRNIPLLP